jgi:HTH-type transcriptional regulator, bacterioopsin transcriptional activator and related proteins
MSVSFVEEVDQAEQLRNRVADLEAQLQEKEQQIHHERQNNDRKLRTLTENLPVILYTLDTEGIVTLSEGKGLAAIGSKPGQSVGKNIFELYKGLPTASDWIRRALAGEDIQTTLTFAGVDMQTWYSPLRDENGTITGMLGLAVDVTERKRAETELRESKNRLELAFQVANLASWDWNMITNYTTYDDGFNRMLGYEPGTLGHDLSGFSNNLHPDDMERTFKAVADYAEGRASKYQTEFRMKHKDGSWRWIYATGTYR